jgi:nucleoside-diphosphate-sugar epimerase
MKPKIIITGAAGLVGQNLVIELKRLDKYQIVGIDKHPYNTDILAKLHPDIKVIKTDILKTANWADELQGCAVLITLHAQIGSKDADDFVDNNVTATRVVIELAQRQKIPYLVHASSSVVESVANDDYTNSKKQQEQLVIDSGIPYCILRPTLMFGWFDRKHLGWLSRFMHRIPVFPIPGTGKFMRQPLYVRDFCKIIAACVAMRPNKQIYNITGREKVFYIDLIKKIRQACGAKTVIVLIPYWVFWVLLKTYAVFSRNPPFTADQLKALLAGDEFELIEWWRIFSIEATPLDQAIQETFNDPTYSNITLEF